MVRKKYSPKLDNVPLFGINKYHKRKEYVGGYRKLKGNRGR